MKLFGQIVLYFQIKKIECGLKLMHRPCIEFVTEFLIPKVAFLQYLLKVTNECRNGILFVKRKRRWLTAGYTTCINYTV